MKVLRGIGKGIKGFVNFPRWMGLSQLTRTGKDITDIGKKLVNSKTTSKRQESFAEAMQRLKLTEKDVDERGRHFLLMARLYAVIGLALLIYTLYLFWQAHLMAAFMSLILTTLGFTLAFRQHFYYFQIKQRKLGCTIKEWIAVNTKRGTRP
ncbi:MAG: hypothetical protein HWD59_00655 [Coxiellaceae bacterium]|nr:MAG: hypothetical protein HWD59_00655 [Coxiellaceae bacterium]